VLEVGAWARSVAVAEVARGEGRGGGSGLPMQSSGRRGAQGGARVAGARREVVL
jgi:hypothetical protein